MSTDYAERHQKTSAGSSRAMGGAASGMGLECLTGDTEMVTTFDDFNGVVGEEGWGDTAFWEQSGWVMTENAGGGALAGDYISMNDPDGYATGATDDYLSCIKIVAGTGEDHGGSMMLDAKAGTVSGATTGQTTNHSFPHIWIPGSATIPDGGGLAGIATDAGEALDGTSWRFACRVGFRSDYNATTGDGEWNSKVFIGYALSGDTSIMTHDTGAVTIASGGPLVGFHIPEDGSIDGISHRTVATAMAEGTNFTEIQPANAVDCTVVNHCDVAYATCWWDLAFRMDITDMSLDAGNGWTRFYSRRVRPGVSLGSWNLHSVVLDNQTPNHATTMVPIIEVLTGPVADKDCAVLVDWWAMGRNRVNR